MSRFERSSLRSLCVICVSAVNSPKKINRRDAERAETAQRLKVRHSRRALTDAGIYDLPFTIYYSSDK
jgi:hypothetical protein